MPKLESQKKWQKDRPEKVKEYSIRYLADKVKITVSLSKSVAESIDTLKNPNESRTEWVRKVILEKLNVTQG